MEENIQRDPRISPDQAGTEQSAQMEKKRLAARLERLQKRANPIKIELAPHNLNLQKSRDIDGDDGEGTDMLVGRRGVAETSWEGKMVREGRLEIVAGGEDN